MNTPLFNHLYSILTRDINIHEVEHIVNSLLHSHLENTIVEDLLVLAFQTRDIRGGRGERHASQCLFEALLTNPITQYVTLDVLDLIPEYGCWQDLFKLSQISSKRVQQIIKSQFDIDIKALNIPGTPISLLAKWLPREGNPKVVEISSLLIPGKMFYGTRMKLYRQKVSSLNKALNTVEIRMCNREWVNISPKEVPAGAMKKYKNAFLNESSVNVLRYPDNLDRMECRHNFLEYLKIRKENKSEVSDSLEIQLNSKRYDLVRNRVRQFQKKIQ